ncbi:HPr family phosphocarrier protein [Cupriavidus basilensis]|uniref:HPr family phosphocarrier protein n=1 Tax=Cupriavidus basilensis TaxID=68895 RepID=A0ABT6AKH7_9BURK|nr:HPr family phosphocarrier protein [Cupriavidus basilensis]MDF3833104.1 HPr family phosphocarrier protein [Cupriavidus basilensis]
MVEATIEMSSPHGLQGRRADRLTKTASQFECNILLSSNDYTANAKNVKEVMHLSSRAGLRLRIQASGVDESVALRVICALLTD